MLAWCVIDMGLYSKVRWKHAEMSLKTAAKLGDMIKSVSRARKFLMDGKSDSRVLIRG
jgi:hypothetical protein